MSWDLLEKLREDVQMTGVHIDKSSGLLLHPTDWLLSYFTAAVIIPWEIIKVKTGTGSYSQTP
jgi:hypothetical protein